MASKGNLRGKGEIGRGREERGRGGKREGGRKEGREQGRWEIWGEGREEEEERKS